MCPEAVADSGFLELVEEFGTKLVDEALLERFERVTGQKPHRFMRRGIVFSHRDLEIVSSWPPGALSHVLCVALTVATDPR